jgi:hypothetical protein
MRLHTGRTYGMNGPNPLSWEGIQAWNNLMGADLTEWEVLTLKALDSTWLRVIGELRND